MQDTTIILNSLEVHNSDILFPIENEVSRILAKKLASYTDEFFSSEKEGVETLKPLFLQTINFIDIWNLIKNPIKFNKDDKVRYLVIIEDDFKRKESTENIIDLKDIEKSIRENYNLQYIINLKYISSSNIIIDNSIESVKEKKKKIDKETTKEDSKDEFYISADLAGILKGLIYKYNNIFSDDDLIELENIGLMDDSNRRIILDKRSLALKNINNPNIKEFSVKCKMNKRWIPYFVSFLKRMESDGNIGHSESIGFYADGDGDFRPKFIFDTTEVDDINPTNKVKPDSMEDINIDIYDAG